MALCSIEDVPPNALLLVLTFLRSPRDVINCGMSAKCFARVYRAEQIWQPLVAQRFDVQLKAVGLGADVDWPDIYRVMRTAPGQHPLRSVQFQGVYTDGDIDEPLVRYWAHNAFSNNQWQVFASDSAPNVHAVGILTDELSTPWEKRQHRVSARHENYTQSNALPHEPVSEAAHRKVLVERLRRPVEAAPSLRGALWVSQNDSPEAAVVCYAAAPTLEQLSTWQLEMLLLYLIPFLQDGQPLGGALLVDEHGMPLSQPAVQELRQSAIEASKVQNSQALAIIRRQSNPRQLLDSCILPFLQTPSDPSLPAHDRIGVVHRLLVRRPQSTFTCPISAGAVFLGHHHSAFRRKLSAADGNHASASGSSAAISEAAFDAFQALVEEDVCTALKGIVTYEDLQRLEPLAVAGVVPRPIRGGRSSFGAWLEFNPDWEPPRGMTLKPVAWFAFAPPMPSTRADHSADVIDFPPHTQYSALPWNAPRSNLTQSDEEDGPIDGDYCEDYDNDAYNSEEENPIPYSNICSVELPLRRMHAGSCAVIKLIDCENRMRDDDEHDHPNIDLAAMAFLGRDVMLPSCVQLAQ